MPISCLNGTLLGRFGNFAGSQPNATEPTVFPFPQKDANNADEVIAFRFWMAPSTLLSIPDRVGFTRHPCSEPREADKAPHIACGWGSPRQAKRCLGNHRGNVFRTGGHCLRAPFLTTNDRVYLWISAFARPLPTLGGAK